MFCPKCKAEYREVFEICSDCNVQLVDELQPETVLAWIPTDINYPNIKFI